MLLGGVSISYGDSLIIGGVGHFLRGSFLLAWGVVLYQPRPHTENKDQ